LYLAVAKVDTGATCKRSVYAKRTNAAENQTSQNAVRRLEPRTASFTEAFPEGLSFETIVQFLDKSVGDSLEPHQQRSKMHAIFSTPKHQLLSVILETRFSDYSYPEDVIKKNSRFSVVNKGCKYRYQIRG
jgi:hypothetical protein